MESLTTYIDTMPTWHRLVVVVSVLSLCWIIEAGQPLRDFGYAKLKHIGINLVFFATTAIIGILFALVFAGLIFWAEENRIGLLYAIDLAPWVHLLLALMALDFVAQFGVHYLLHHVKWMWRLHMVHHSDTTVDATTGTRHHPLDYVTRELASLTAILVFGIPMTYYLIYRLITIPFTYFTHANIRLPDGVDRAISFVFVSPNMHKFHHHESRPWTDSNFGNILSIWDRMFGTMVYEKPEDIRYGLDVVDNSKDMSLGYQFALPFNSAIKTDSRKSWFRRLGSRLS